MLFSNGNKMSPFKDGKKMSSVFRNGKMIYKSGPKIVDFSTGTDEEIKAMLEAHYKGQISISDYWKVGDTRVMHLNAMASGTGASESHVEQDMTMIIIGIEHDNLKTPINGKTKAAITLQCREVLGNNEKTEQGYIWGSNTSTNNTDNYSNNPRRTWLNGTFINSLPSGIQPLVKTVIKKNLANHTDSTAGPNTEDKAFLTSYSEIFGSESYFFYYGSVELEGEQYEYMKTSSNRIKYINNNGIAGNSAEQWWLRSPSIASDSWLNVDLKGSYSVVRSIGCISLAPAFCL